MTSTADDRILVTCPECGATNRFLRERVASGATTICGRCKAPLSGVSDVGAGDTSHPVVVTDKTFATEVEQSALPVLVDFWAPWCGPCRMLAPVLDQVAAEFAGRVKVAKLNVDENKRSQARFQVRGIPALLLFKDGREIDRIVGMVPKAEILRHVKIAIG